MALGAGADSVRRWSNVAEVAAEAVPDALSERVPGQVGDAWYVELPESGWGALVGWVAGPAHLLRVADELDRHATVTTWRHGNEVTESVATRTPGEQESVDRDINEYLTAAGVPERVPARRWLIRLPRGFADGDALFSAVGAAIAESAGDARHPAEFVGPLTAYLTAHYSADEPS